MVLYELQPITVSVDYLFWKLVLIILSITFGMVGTLSFGLSLKDAALVILFFTLVSTVPVAYMCTWGPKTGMRQLVLARFAFG
jgi:purine-cytosine permease-like protein